MVASIGKIASPSQGVSYFEKDGYYAKDDAAHREASAWVGAAALGLSGQVLKRDGKNFALAAVLRYLVIAEIVVSIHDLQGSVVDPLEFTVLRPYQLPGVVPINCLHASI